ncbi:MAG TPA: GNAT family protein [Anaerolineaceae bacterium]|nr:GNAT family protein [Anaerolineaceae bacterium]HPN51141.1 GNAT family protein [Anaerolineaceae bacterium]
MPEELGRINQESLFLGERIRLTALDPETDAETVKAWSKDAEGYAVICSKPPRPLSAGQAKALLQPPETSDSPGQFKFGIHLAADDRLVGLAEVQDVDWRHGGAWLVIKIGAEADRGKGYGTEAMRLLLRFAFEELNLFRVNAKCEGYQVRGTAFLAKMGFREEIRRRAAVYRSGQRWDALIFGLLREQWEAQHA